MPGIYISYPFCSQKCTYCNFASGVFSSGQQQRYEAALARELDDQVWQWKPQTLYLGGGTPSLLPAATLRSWFGRLPREALVETTLECAPGTVTPERAEGWASLGINRISFGVQSFVPEELRRTGRRHTPETVVAETQLLGSAGITNVNIDLIAGLPGQTLASWRESLLWVSRLQPPHVSVYIFEIDEESNLGREATLGGIRYGAGLLPSEDAVAEMYEMAVAHLAAEGIHRYEISNFARPGFESRHNLKYWRREPYIGFGLDAHSFDGETRWGNLDSLEPYLDAVLSGGSPIRERSTPDAEEERFFVGLRLSAGVQPTLEEWRRFSGVIQPLVAAGLLEREGPTLRLSPRGFLLSNEVFQNFIAVGVG